MAIPSSDWSHGQICRKAFFQINAQMDDAFYDHFDAWGSLGDECPIASEFVFDPDRKKFGID